MSDKINNEENKEKIDLKLTTDEIIPESQTPQQPIEVKIVDSQTLDQKQKEFFDRYDLLIKKMQEALDIIPPKPGKIERAWMWFQKHAFNYVIVLAIGISIGVGIDKIMVYNDTMDAVNKQIMEYKGDLFSVQPSPIKKYYTNGKKTFSSIISKTEEPIEDDTKK